MRARVSIARGGGADALAAALAARARLESVRRARARTRAPSRGVSPFYANVTSSPRSPTRTRCSRAWRYRAPPITTAPTSSPSLDDGLRRPRAGGPAAVDARARARVDVAVAAVNDAPTLAAPEALAAVEDTPPAAVAGVAVGDVDAAESFSGLVEVTAAVGNGTLALGSTVGLHVLEDGRRRRAAALPRRARRGQRGARGPRRTRARRIGAATTRSRSR